MDMFGSSIRETLLCPLFGHGFLSGAELGILTLVGTPEEPFLYQWRVMDCFVHQKSLSCTSGVSWTVW